MKFNMFKLGDKNKNSAPEKGGKKTEAASAEANGEIASIVDAPPIRPHGPAGELSLDDGGEQNGDIALDEISDNPEEFKAGEVKNSVIPKENLSSKQSGFKTSKVGANGEESGLPSAAAPQPVAAIPEAKAADPGTTDLNSLFSMDEDEENPLAALMASLPDVTARELMDDLDEIHRIIKEWKPNQGGGGIPR
ncbi:MAG TPA: hypothetical protein VMB24_03220 [Dehalococcoidales bacterium]|nr:hypothetical protein [Dehalococcoidales bacterium]